MKKKLLLLTVLVVALVCLLAVSISARTVISENNISENDDIVADVLVNLGDNYYIVSVDISYNDTNGQTKNGKFYYKTSHWSQRNMRQVKEVYVPADFDFSQMIYIFDKADYDGNNNYASNELTKLYEGGGGFKMYSYTSYENGTFTDTANVITSIQRISYSKYFVKLADRGFGNKAPKLTTITYNGREPIENALIVSPLIDEIFGGSFGGDGSSLTANTMSTITPFTKLIFEDREISVSFGQYCFTRNVIEEIYFGKGTYNLGNKERIALLFGNDYANGAGATLKTVILHKDAVIGSGEISWNVGSYDVVVLGKESECKAFYEANHQSKLPCAKSVTYNPCYYGHTSEDDYNCATAVICKKCDEALVEAKEHTLNEALKYENGYASTGVYTATCTNEGCKYATSEEACALFACLGFSTPADGRDGLVISFSVNGEAIAKYTELTGNTFKYGAFAVAESKIGTNDVVDASGNAVDYAICAELSSYGFASFDLVIVGFGDDQKDFGLAMGAYVIDGDTVSYMQAGAPIGDAKYYFASYNTVMELIAASKGAK